MRGWVLGSIWLVAAGGVMVAVIPTVGLILCLLGAGVSVWQVWQGWEEIRKERETKRWMHEVDDVRGQVEEEIAAGGLRRERALGNAQRPVRLAREG